MSKEHKALTGSFASLASGSLATPLWFDEPKHFDPRPDCTAFRTVWICDTHLGTPGCNAELLLDFLRSIDCETLYLVGDIVDGWQLRKGWYWLLRYNDVVCCILKQAKHGTRVVYVPGSHDEAFRDYVGLNFGGVEVLPKAIHLTADSRKLLIVHGDEFDGFVIYTKWLAFLGDHAYTVLLKFNRTVNAVRRWFKLPYWSLAARLKKKRSRTRSPSSRASRKRSPPPSAVPTGSSAAISTRPKSARSATSLTTTTATGSKAAPRWSSMPTGRWRSSTGQRKFATRKWRSAASPAQGLSRGHLPRRTPRRRTRRRLRRGRRLRLSHSHRHLRPRQHRGTDEWTPGRRLPRPGPARHRRPLWLRHQRRHPPERRARRGPRSRHRTCPRRRPLGLPRGSRPLRLVALHPGVRRRPRPPPRCCTARNSRPRLRRGLTGDVGGPTQRKINRLRLSLWSCRHLPLAVRYRPERST